MAGHYEFGEEPPDMWCRHDNCRCEIVYANGYKVQSLRGTKKSWDIKTDHSYEEYRAKQPDKKTAESAEKYEPETLTREQAAQAEAAGLAKYANALDFSAGSGIMDKGIKVDMQYFAKKSSDFPTVQLSKNEYAHVMSEIATHISEEQKAMKTFSKPIGDHMYLVENNGFGDYRIIGKKKLK